MRLRALAALVATLTVSLLTHPLHARAKPSMVENHGSFEHALAAFRAHAAHEFGVEAARVRVVPSAEAAANDWKITPPDAPPVSAKVGRAWAFAASTDGNSAEVHGWALPDGRVITLRHDLGLLFEEAGVFAHRDKVNPFELARRLLWGAGNNYDLREDPTLVVNKDGTGTMHLVCAYLPPLGGMAPMELRYDWTFKLEPNHVVKLEEKRLQ